MCNYPYHELSKPSEERKRIVCILFSKRGRAEAERAWDADAAMLAEIAAKPNPEPDRPAEMYGAY